jgi:hypothetical protein
MTATANAREPQWFARTTIDGLIRLAVEVDADDDVFVSAVDFLLGSDVSCWTVTALETIMDGYDVWEMQRDLRVV